MTVAKEIELKNPYENMGAQLVREVASKTSDTAGDRPPPPPLSARSPWRSSRTTTPSGPHSMEMLRGSNTAVDVRIAELKNLSYLCQNKT